MKKGYYANIEQLTEENTEFRKVLYTGEESQLVLMAIPPSCDIGVETHTENDQFFRFESGEGKVLINGNEYTVGDGDCIIVPKGAEHNVMNISGTEPLKLYTIYSPAHHMDGTVHPTKEYADTHEEEFDGTTTE